MAPLETLVPTSPYGLRISPLTGTAGEFHWGQDYAAACGTRVYAADTGVVRAVGWHPWGGGNRVEIDHGNGLITTYNHLEAIAVKKGDSVQVGQIIARVGTTGSSTGCHLHFETILNGAHTDPLGWAMIPIHQVDQLGPIDMVSYEPDAGKASNASLGWAIPVQTDLTHVVAGGAQEQTVAATAAVTAAAPAASAAASDGSHRAAPATGHCHANADAAAECHQDADRTKTPTPTPSVHQTPSATAPPDASCAGHDAQRDAHAGTDDAPGASCAANHAGVHCAANHAGRRRSADRAGRRRSADRAPGRAAAGHGGS